MNRASVIALVLAGILFGCAAGLVAHEVIESDAGAQSAYTGTRWEYKVHTASMNYQKDLPVLKEWGMLGWEMFDYEGGGYFFKRPLTTPVATVKPLE